MTTIHELVSSRGARTPAAAALLAPGGQVVTYGELADRVRSLGAALNQQGFTTNDRVAIVAPNGPIMAATFLGVSSVSASCPLNPGYREEELAFYLDDLAAKAVVLAGGTDSPVAGVANSLGIPVLELDDDGNLPGPSGPCSPATEGDVALILHTSGTTSRPKLVPLTNANVCTSAANIAATLDLGTDDRCLNVMPLFHIHGLMAAVLASVSSGSSIVCTPGFDQRNFFRWADENEATWYTAVPTMHQAVLAQAALDPGGAGRTRLRLIRSSSASLAPEVMTALEARFGAPVIESYGMTEASHQMASNPLPPMVRKPGSVGPAAGPDVAIMAEDGTMLTRGETGEIVIRGPSVTAGYGTDDPAVNEAAFISGWFRTGDQGRFDDDGYLAITGRLKEIINRGGETIAPREIDEVFLSHPAVVQATAFAVPHPTLEEDVAVAVVLEDSADDCTEQTLRAFAFERLADYKVPSRVVIVDAVPKGPTGKLRRIGLADLLADALAASYEDPRDDLESSLLEQWQAVLDEQDLGIHHNFFAMGGDSLLAVELFDRMNDLLGVDVPVATLFRAPTIAELAPIVRAWDPAEPATPLVPLSTEGQGPPLFLVHAHSGEVIGFEPLVRHLGRERPVFGLRARGLDGTSPPAESVEEMAIDYLSVIREVQPEGPYLLAGYCLGGDVALEMARLLRAGGDEVALTLLLGSVHPSAEEAMSRRAKRRHHLERRLALESLRFRQRGRSRYATSRIEAVSHRVSSALPAHGADGGTGPEIYRRLVDQANTRALASYRPEPYDGPVVILNGDRQIGPGMNPRFGWTNLTGLVTIDQVSGIVEELIAEPVVADVANRIRRHVQRSLSDVEGG